MGFSFSFYLTIALCLLSRCFGVGKKIWCVLAMRWGRNRWKQVSTVTVRLHLKCYYGYFCFMAYRHPSSWSSSCGVTLLPIRHQSNGRVFFVPIFRCSMMRKSHFLFQPHQGTYIHTRGGVHHFVLFYSEATPPHFSSNYNKLVWNVGSSLTSGSGKVIRIYAYLLALSIIGQPFYQ